MAGNVLEWTLEYTSVSSESCAYRGGDYVYDGGDDPAVDRDGTGRTDYANNVGFRGALY